MVVGCEGGFVDWGESPLAVLVVVEDEEDGCGSMWGVEGRSLSG